MPSPSNRPILLLLTSHWISMAGVACVTLAGFSWLFLLPLNIGGHAENPYVGLLVFIAIPILFFMGLALIPVGILLAKRRAAGFLGSAQAGWRRAGIFFGCMTLVNIVIGSQLSYRAVDHMDTVQFCGQSCHVMKPEFTAHQQPPHQQVACVACHVAPGAAGWVKAKSSGVRQLIAVLLNNYPRPIQSAMESNRLVSSADTCEQCHARARVAGSRLRIQTKYKDDELNTRTETVLMMLVGGGAAGGIHGAHLGSGVRIRYAARDAARQEIPWVEYRNTATGAARTYAAGDSKPDAPPSYTVFEMQCVDCHNRPAHTLEQPDQAVDRAMAGGRIPATLPFVKKTGLALLQAPYNTDAEAEERITGGLTDYYRKHYPDVAASRGPEIQAAGRELAAIYARNVFPDLKVTWGTYPNNLGHVDSPGCFRCHDGNHVTAANQTISQDCSLCHRMLAVDEPSPEVLKTLGLSSN